MLKYTLGTLVALATIAAVSFLLLARLNGSDVDAGPASALAIVADDDGATPERVELPRGRLTVLTFENRAALTRRLQLVSDDVEQSPFETNPQSHGTPARSISLVASPGQTARALVRFRKDAIYEMRVETPGRPETLSLVRVVVK